MSVPPHGRSARKVRTVTHERNDNYDGARGARIAINVRIGSLEASCWGAGLALIALYSSSQVHGELERRGAVSSFSQRQAQPLVAAAPFLGTPLGARPVAAAPVDARGAPDQMRSSRYAGTASEEQASARLAAAVLRIPRVALEVPVYSDSSQRNLNRGAGLIAGTGAPDSNGNIAIAAHRDGYFRALRNVALGDLVELETRERRRQYRVTGLSIVDPTDVSPLHDTEVPAVTLVTCYPFYFVGSAPQRYIVRAEAIE